MQIVFLLSILFVSVSVHSYHHHHAGHGEHDHHHGGHGEHNHHEPHIGYFWEDYTEESISHAVPGGKDSHGKITYIGQVKREVDGKDVLTPGIIYPDENLMVYESKKNPEKIHENFKILCTKYPHHMQWFSTDTEAVHKSSHEFIEGGIDEHYHKIYIGRVQTDDGLLIGQVLMNHGDHGGFHGVGPSGYVHKTSFEILAHVMVD